MTPEFEKVKRISDNYIALKRAINDPNYPSTTHTQAALMNVEDKIRQMGRNHVFKLAFEKLIPINFKQIMGQD
jgi:hypothetical protein